jgi:hypothetical protein
LFEWPGGRLKLPEAGWKATLAHGLPCAESSAFFDILFPRWRSCDARRMWSACEQLT